ncbi:MULTISPECIES: hypothetical protein [unclassified Bradyrhizobium]|uniref:hypothetical protein n=1 Tax=unclassified Bradyrhizobium TaxID=2631580 RepID=UPI002916E2CA|nr:MULTISPECIES: hypothetical protein [unclassified Bradyrhizobium]
MIEPIRSLSVDVVPQAILALPIHKVIGKRADISRGIDDLDYFEGASFKLDDKVEIAVRHYHGHPEDTATIYIDSRENDIEHITQIILRILKELHVPPTALKWQRRDNPDL